MQQRCHRCHHRPGNDQVLGQHACLRHSAANGLAEAAVVYLDARLEGGDQVAVEVAKSHINGYIKCRASGGEDDADPT